MSAAPKEVTVKLKLPGFELGGKWEVTNMQRKAAWELYVELATRVTTVPLEPDEGLIREALSSMYSLFNTTRDILKRHGPALAKSGNGKLSFAVIAVTVLNSSIRPFLSRWHPRLEDHEARRSDETSRWKHEADWEHAPTVRQELRVLRDSLQQYAELLELALSLEPSNTLLLKSDGG